MKKLLTIFTFVLLVLTSPSFAQENIGWTRVESEKREVSVSIPPDFLVDTETENYRKKISIYGFSKDAEMRFAILKPNNPKQSLKNIRISEDSDQAGNSFEINGLNGVNLVSRKPKRYENTFFLASNDYLYRIAVTAKLNSNKEIISAQEVARFINSIKVNGQQLIVPAKQYTEPADKIIAASSLTTSPVILEVLQKKDSKNTKKYKLKYETPDVDLPTDEISYSRPLIILRRPLPRYTDLARNRNIRGSVKLKINFLANGEAGEITVLSKLDLGLEVNAAAEARRIKFLPAEVNGKAVDAVEVITYNFALQ